jgi:hypothetical protein
MLHFERELYVILTPKEINKFKKFSTILQIPHGILTVLKKSTKGNCIFYDEKKEYLQSI